MDRRYCQFCVLFSFVVLYMLFRNDILSFNRTTLDENTGISSKMPSSRTAHSIKKRYYARYSSQNSSKVATVSPQTTNEVVKTTKAYHINIIEVDAEIKLPLHPPQQATTINSFKPSYAEALSLDASPNKGIILALIDGGFLDMALNFYKVCLEPYSIDNYLLIASDWKTCDHMNNLGIHCFCYRTDEDSSKASEYHSKSFLRKMNVRTDMILDALELGYSVLHTDIDMYCYQNPITRIDCEIKDCDMVALQDTSNYNAGFIYVNPTKASKNVYATMQEIAKKSSTTDDQVQLNTAIQKQQKYPEFKAKKLNAYSYQCGKFFFEDARRYFALGAKPCENCILVHNNWIVSMEAKVYRAKELHQWMYDGDEYYSSTTNRYLSYSNWWFGEKSIRYQLSALRSALAIGKTLKRIVVLPQFICKDNQGHHSCSLISFMKLMAFDKAFKNQYRENSFLTHPLVPNSIIEDTSKPYMIKNDFVPPNEMYQDFIEVELKNPSIGLNDRNVVDTFGQVAHKVIHFAHLYDVFDRFTNDTANREFAENIKAGFQPSCYRQYAYCNTWPDWLKVL